MYAAKNAKAAKNDSIQFHEINYAGCVVGSMGSSSSLRFFADDINEYMAGITNNVRIKEKIIPLTITMPKGTRLVTAAPSESAIGNAPNAIARLVINIGRNRCPET